MTNSPVIPFARLHPAARLQYERIALDGAAPLRLDEVDGFWVVERGQVDLFAVALDGDAPCGVRLPLRRIEAGELISGIPRGGDRTIIAVGHIDTAILPLAPDAPETAALLDGWLARIATAVFGDAPVWPETVAAPGDRLDLAAGKLLYAARAPVWVASSDGRVLIGGGTIGDSIIGDGAIEAIRAVPIAAGMALYAAEDCTIDAAATAQILARSGARDGLDQFHTAVLTAVGEQLTAAEEAGLRRSAGRSAAESRSIDWALRQLAAVAGRTEAEIEPPLSREPLVEALGVIAARLGIELARLPRAPSGVASPLRAIARANGIGLRTVVLRGPWWRDDNGPLLAWRGDPQQPVALLPAGRSYRLWDAVARSFRVVDATLAAELSPNAVMLYRPAPEQMRGIGVLLRFAGRGIGRDVATIAGTAAFGGAVAMAVPLATGFLLETAVPRAEAGQVLAVVIGLALAGLAAGVFDLTRAIALVRLQGRFEAAMQPALMHRLLRLPVNFFRGFGTGELTNRILSIQAVRQLLAGNALVSLFSAVIAGASLMVILLYSPVLALLAAGLVLLAAMMTGGLAIGELRQERARLALRGQEDSLVIQIIQGIAKLRVAAAERRIFAQWAGLFSRQKRHFRRGRRYAALAESIAEVYPILAILVLYLVAARLFRPDDAPSAPLGLGAFLAINAAFGQLFAATMTLARTAAGILEAVALFERLRPIVTAEPERVGDKLEPAPLSGRIEINQLGFRYAPGGALVLDNLSLTVEPGQFVAIVGPSGGGKSTLLRLLLGFERAERGDILYDGQSIGALDAAALRRQIGVVLQAGRIMTGSIFENITGGLPYTVADAWEAARLAGIDADIEALPMGMHTVLIEGSSTLSGGQQQRLMIARALVGRPRILLFDEATSALDNRSQAVVAESLARLRTTRIVIAHRLSTVQQADRIFVIEGGRLAESGRFDELMTRDGPFSRLARRQIL